MNKMPNKHTNAITNKQCFKYHLRLSSLSGSIKHDMVIARDPFEACAVAKQRWRDAAECNVLNAYELPYPAKPDEPTELSGGPDA